MSQASLQLVGGCPLTDKISTTPTSWKAPAKDMFAQMENDILKKSWKNLLCQNNCQIKRC